MSETSKDNILHYMYEDRDFPDEYNSDFSDIIEVTTDTDNIPPKTPGSLSATSKIGKINLNFVKPTKNEDGSKLNDFERYKIYRGTTSGFSTAGAATDFTDTTDYVHNTHQYGTTYAYRVSALDYTENESPLTQEVYGSPSRTGSNDIGLGEIEETNISASAVSSPKLQGSIVQGKHLQGSIIQGKHFLGSIVQTKHLQASIAQTKHLVAGAVTAPKANIGTLSALTGNMGTLTAGYFELESGKIEIGDNVLGSGLHGLLINDGTNDRVRIGELSSGTYGMEAQDSDGDTVWSSDGEFLGKGRARFTKMFSGVPTTSTDINEDLKDYLDLPNGSYLLVMAVDFNDSSGYSRVIMRGANSIGWDPIADYARGANTVRVGTGHDDALIVTPTTTNAKFTWRTPDATDIEIFIRVALPILSN